MRPRIWAILCGLAAVGLVEAASADSHWPGWRGPTADGHSVETGLPVTWSAESVTWKSPLPGDGHSSPVIWGERIFLTSAEDEGRRRLVFCVDRRDGRILWQRVVWTGDPEPVHRMNGFASATCTTDGERVYAFFGRGGLHCLTVDGDPVWSKDLGQFEGPWGTAACPVLVGDLVIQNCDADADACLAAFDKVTGAPVWRTEREDYRGWSTPVLVQGPDQAELVLNGHTGTRAYDPQSGRELWFCKGYRGRGTPTVTPANGLVYVVNGLPGDIYAVRPGGRGEVIDTHREWHTPRKGRDLPSPIVLGDYLLVMNKDGILTAYDATGGKELWKERIGGTFAASPVAYQGHAFFMRENGDVIVVKPNDSPQIVATNSIAPGDEEIFRATVTPSDGQVFLRSNRFLYCIGTRAPASE